MYWVNNPILIISRTCCNCNCIFINHSNSFFQVIFIVFKRNDSELNIIVLASSMKRNMCGESYYEIRSCYSFHFSCPVFVRKDSISYWVRSSSSCISSDLRVTMNHISCKHDNFFFHMLYWGKKMLIWPINLGCHLHNSCPEIKNLVFWWIMTSCFSVFVLISFLVM